MASGPLPVRGLQYVTSTPLAVGRGRERTTPVWMIA